jgi:hypothetical protein
MAKFTDVIRYMARMNKRYADTSANWQLLKLFLKKNHPTVYKVMYIPMIFLAGVLVFWLALLIIGNLLAVYLIVPVTVALVGATLNLLICQYIGVSHLLEEENLNPSDWQNEY